MVAQVRKKYKRKTMEPPNNQKKLGRKKTQNRIQFMHGTYHEQYKEHT